MKQLYCGIHLLYCCRGVGDQLGQRDDNRAVTKQQNMSRNSVTTKETCCGLNYSQSPRDISEEHKFIPQIIVHIPL